MFWEYNILSSLEDHDNWYFNNVLLQLCSETDEHDDLEDEEEEEEEDVGVGEELSASQLLMQHMGADGQQAYPEEEEEYY